MTRQAQLFFCRLKRLRNSYPFLLATYLLCWPRTLPQLFHGVVLAQGAQLQKAVIEVGEDRLLGGGRPDRPFVEPHLAVDPKDPNHLVAAAIVVSKLDLSEQSCAAFTSFDGGKAWKFHDFHIRDGVDPWVAITADGIALFAALGSDGLVVFQSTDGGRTWPDHPVSLGRGHDHPTMVVDPTAGPLSGNIYLVSGRGRRNHEGKQRFYVFVARSADGGKTFQETAHYLPSNLNFEAQNPVVLSDGTLIVPFRDHHRIGDDRRWLQRPRDWLITSDDRGKTFSEPLLVSESCDGRGGWPSLAADASRGPFRDRLYWLCTKEQFGGVQIQFSQDRGETWRDPIRVDQSENPYERTPSIAVNKNGVVGIAWYDRRNDPARQCQDIYLTASLDGGETFLPEVKVSTKISCPVTPQNGGAAQRWPAGGDYSGLVAKPDGTFQVLWADSRDGTYQLRTATVKVIENGRKTNK